MSQFSNTVEEMEFDSLLRDLLDKMSDDEIFRTDANQILGALNKKSTKTRKRKVNRSLFDARKIIAEQRRAKESKANVTTKSESKEESDVVVESVDESIYSTLSVETQLVLAAKVQKIVDSVSLDQLHLLTDRQLHADLCDSWPSYRDRWENMSTEESKKLSVHLQKLLDASKTKRKATQPKVSKPVKRENANAEVSSQQIIISKIREIVHTIPDNAIGSTTSDMVVKELAEVCTFEEENLGDITALAAQILRDVQFFNGIEIQDVQSRSAKLRKLVKDLPKDRINTVTEAYLVDTFSSKHAKDLRGAKSKEGLREDARRVLESARLVFGNSVQSAPVPPKEENHVAPEVQSKTEQPDDVDANKQNRISQLLTDCVMMTGGDFGVVRAQLDEMETYIQRTLENPEYPQSQIEKWNNVKDLANWIKQEQETDDVIEQIKQNAEPVSRKRGFVKHYNPGECVTVAQGFLNSISTTELVKLLNDPNATSIISKKIADQGNPLTTGLTNAVRVQIQQLRNECNISLR